LISWEYSFEKISKDLELAKKKKQALDDLFNTGKISQPTYDSFNKGLTDTITEIETHRKALAENMTSKITELEQQVNTLEMFLANAEILYAAGEIDEELHTRESNAFTQGLEATKQELEVIKEVVANLMPEKMVPTLPLAPGEIAEAPPAEEVLEEASEIPTEVSIEAPVEAQVEVETENISEETEIEQPMEVQAEEALVEEASTEEALTEEAPDEGFEGFEENAPETPTEEQFSPSEEVVEEPAVPPEVVTEEVVEETPIEGETEVEVEAEAEDTSFFRDEEEEATAEEQEAEE